MEQLGITKIQRYGILKIENGHIEEYAQIAEFFDKRIIIDWIKLLPDVKDNGDKNFQAFESLEKYLIIFNDCRPDNINIYKY